MTWVRRVLCGLLVAILRGVRGGTVADIADSVRQNLPCQRGGEGCDNERKEADR